MGGCQCQEGSVSFDRAKSELPSRLLCLPVTGEENVIQGIILQDAENIIKTADS